LNIHLATLLLVTLVWGGTFPVLKIATAQLSGVEVSALRFVIAALCMLPFVVRVSRQTWRDGALLGVLALLSYVLQAYGMESISSNRSAFLTSLNVLMVPLIGLLLGTPLTWTVLGAATLACAGIGLMSWDGGSNLVADMATVGGALAYALYVIFLSRRSSRHQPSQLAAAQIVCMAVLGCGAMMFDAWGTDKLNTLSARIDTSIFLGLVYLGAVATAGVLFLQAMAQRHVSAEQAALVYAMEPVFAAVFAWLWLSEVLTWTAALGGCMVVVAVVTSELHAVKPFNSQPCPPQR
jgi:drug/metabolite transporter (DMT)-like permease